MGFFAHIAAGHFCCRLHIAASFVVDVGAGFRAFFPTFVGAGRTLHSRGIAAVRGMLCVVVTQVVTLRRKHRGGQQPHHHDDGKKHA